MIDILDRQTSMLSRLVDDLLNLARIKANKIELRSERLELVDVIEAAIGSCRSLIDQRQHTLVFDTLRTTDRPRRRFGPSHAGDLEPRQQRRALHRLPAVASK